MEQLKLESDRMLNDRMFGIERELNWHRIKIHTLENQLDKCKLTSMLFGAVGLLAIIALVLAIVK